MMPQFASSQSDEDAFRRHLMWEEQQKKLLGYGLIAI